MGKRNKFLALLLGAMLLGPVGPLPAPAPANAAAVTGVGFAEETITVGATATGITATLCTERGRQTPALLEVLTNAIYFTLDSPSATPDSGDYTAALGTVISVERANYLRMIRQTSDSSVKVTCFRSGQLPTETSFDKSGSGISGSGATITNVSELDGNTINLGAGTVGTGTIRTTQGSDSPAVVALEILSGAASLTTTTSQNAAVANGNGTAVDVSGMAIAMIHQVTTGDYDFDGTLSIEVAPSSTAIFRRVDKWEINNTFSLGTGTIALSDSNDISYLIDVRGMNRVQTVLAAMAGSAGSITVTVTPMPGGSGLLGTLFAQGRDNSTAIPPHPILIAGFDGTNLQQMSVNSTGEPVVAIGSTNTVVADAGTNLNTSALLTAAQHDAALGTAGAADSQVRSVQGIAGGITLPVTASAGTNLNTSLLLTTSAHDNALGTAGAADAQVRSVQGIAGGTALPISASSLPLPAGAATSALQLAAGHTVTANAGTNLNTSALLTTTAHDAALGTAGAADAQVRSIQGIASGTPVEVDLAGNNDVTVTSGNVTVDAPVGTPIFVRLSDGANAIDSEVDDTAIAVAGPVAIIGYVATPSDAAVDSNDAGYAAMSLDRRQLIDSNLQIANVDIPGGLGVLTANVPRVTIAQDDEINDDIDAIRVATQAINTKLVTGTVIGDVNLGATDNAVLDSIADGITAEQVAGLLHQNSPTTQVATLSLFADADGSLSITNFGASKAIAITGSGTITNVCLVWTMGAITAAEDGDIIFFSADPSIALEEANLTVAQAKLITNIISLTGANATTDFATAQTQCQATDESFAGITHVAYHSTGSTQITDEDLDLIVTYRRDS